MNRLEESDFDAESGPIPLEQLKKIVGGNRPYETKPMDGDRATALTAGAEATAMAPASGDALGFTVGQAPKVIASQITTGTDGQFSGALTYGPPQAGSSNGFVGKVDVTFKGKNTGADSVEVTVFDHGKQESVKLTAADVAKRAGSGDGLYTDLNNKLSGLQNDKATERDAFNQNIEKSFRESVKTKTAGPAEGYYSTEAKAKITLLKPDDKGQLIAKYESSSGSKGWKSQIEHARDEIQEDNNKAVVKASKAHDEHAATHEVVRGNEKAASEAVKSAQKGLQDSIRDQHAKRAEAGTAAQDKAAAEANYKDAAKTSVKAQSEARSALEKSASAKPFDLEKGFRTTDDLHASGKNSAVQKGTTTEARDALVKAIVSGTVAKDAVARAGKDLEAANHRADAAQKTFEQAKQTVKDNQASVTKAESDALAAKKALETADKVKAEKAAIVKAAQDKAAIPPIVEAARDKIKQDSRNDLKNFGNDKGWGKTTELARDILLDKAKQDAKSRDKYVERNPEYVLAGGTTQTVTVSDNATVKATDTARIKTETKTIDFDSDYGSQHTREAAIRLQAGAERITTVDLGAAGTLTEVKKAYAEVGGEAKAEIIKTDAKVTVEASAKLVAHAEAKYSETIKTGSLETTRTVSATAHGEAGVKAGASLGFDGASIKLGASAEISAKANLIHEAKIGDVTLKSDLEVFAKAKAEAHADAKVNFNPFGKEGIGAKVGVGAEAAAGVGVQKTVGMKSAGGGGAEVGGGLYAGKIGVKADVDLGYKDGKLSAGINLGAALGVGLSVNIKIDTNIKLAMENAKRDIEKGNVFEQFRGALTNNPIGGFFRGFFS